MKLLGPIFFLIFGGIGFLGLTAFQAKSNSDGGTGLLALVASQFVNDFTPAPREEPIELAEFLPDAPAGWAMKHYSTPDGEALTGATYRKSAVAVDTTNTYLSKFETAKADKNGVAMTYVRGPLRVLVAMSMRSERDMKSLQGSILTAISGNLTTMNVSGHDGWSDNDFARLYGITFKEGSQIDEVMATGTKVPINYRRFTTSMAGQLNITIMTNASDAAIASVMQNIDILGLNDALMEPDPRVTPATGFVTRVAGQLDREPRAPTAAYQAYTMLRSGEQISPVDARFLSMVAEFKLKTWEQVYNEYGLVDEISSAALELLGPQPRLSEEERNKNRAIYLLRDEGRWQEHEVQVLEALKRGRLEYQSQRARYFDIDQTYDDEIMEILRVLPEEPPEEARHVQQARRLLATPERWHPYENQVLRQIVDGEIRFQEEATTITAAAMGATGLVMNDRITRFLMTMPTADTGNQSAMAPSANGGVPVVRRGGQTRGNSLGGSCTTNELGVRQCVVGDEAAQQD